MEPVDFLRTILPDEGWYCLARPHPKGYFLHKTVDSIQAVADNAVQMDEMLHDVYFCIANLKQEKVWDAQKNNGKGGHRYRTKSNIKSLKSVFFEVDVVRPGETPDEKKYDSREEALSAVKAFCKAVGWPLPFLVSSGWGYHLYWPLNEAVTPEVYEVFIKKLKLLAKAQQLKLDISAADVSRVFRVPGTHNNKDPHNRRKVEVLRQGTFCDFEHLSDAVDRVLDKSNISTQGISERMNVPEYLNFGESNISDFQEPLKLRPMLAKCGALKEAFTNPNDINYHQWYHTLQVLRFCDRGDELAHRVSSLADGYSADETDKMLRSLVEKDIPPTLCDTFAHNAAACATCPYRHKVRSPAAFGRDIKTAQENARLTMQAATGKVPPPPWPYRHEPGKGVIREVKDKDGNVTEFEVFAYDMEPVKRLFSEREQREITRWRTNNPADGVVDIEVPSADLYDKRSFAKTLADAGVYCDLSKVSQLQDYMISYTQEIQKIFVKEYLFSRLGWREDADNFVLGERLFTATGPKACNAEKGGRVMGNTHSSGTLDDWRKIIDFYQDSEFAAHQFGIGVGFAAPLLRFTGIAGGIVNMVGRSGEGKSTVQKIVNSIWGHPTKLMLPAEARSSTYNAKISFINMMNTLPICAEELTNAPIDEVGSLAYAITQGTEKWRADIKGNVREGTGGWCTLMLSSANNSLHEQLVGSAGAAAKALRIFEYRLAHVRKWSKNEFSRGVDLQLLEHYGVAGPVYADYLTRNIDTVRQKVYDTMLWVDTTMHLLPEERIWSAVIACVLSGLEIAQELGLHDFEQEPIVKFVEDHIRQLRQSVDYVTPMHDEVLSQYLCQHIRDTLVVEEIITGKTKSTYVVHKPMGELRIRYELHTQEIHINAGHFRQWCLEQQYNFGEMYDGLVFDGILIPRYEGKTKRPVKRTLSIGTDMSTGQTRVYTINADAQAFSGGMRRVKTLFDENKQDTINERDQRAG